MKNIKFYIVITILLAFSIVLIYNHIKTNEKLNTIVKSNNSYKDSLRIYILKIDSLNLEINETYAENITQKEALQKEIITKEKYKKLYLTSLQSVTKLEGEINILKDSLQSLPDSTFIVVTDTNETYKAIKLPFEWIYKDKYLNFKTGIREDTRTYFDLNMNLNGEVIIGKRKDNIGIFITDNPYFTTKKMEVTVIQPKFKWYESKWFFGGVGFGIGTLLNLIK